MRYRYIEAFLLMFVENINNAERKKNPLEIVSERPSFAYRYISPVMSHVSSGLNNRPITQRRQRQRHTLDYIIVDYESEVSFYFFSVPFLSGEAL